MITVVLLTLILSSTALAARTPASKQAWQQRWEIWLPDKWVRIARCETRLTWTWNSGTYQGAFGFHRDSWDRFRPRGYPSEAYNATPWQQYRVALAIWRRFGFSGWGCRGA